MKKAYTFAVLALIILAAAAMSASAQTQCYPSGSCYVTSGGNTQCTSCQSAAWDRTPIYVTPEGRGPCVSPACPPNAVIVDPWQQCGAYCYAGQLPQGWPYGWCADYWNRPNSNF